MNNKFYIGVDVSQSTLDIHLRPLNRFLQIPNQTSHIQQLIKELIPLQPEKIVIEATGGLERNLTQALHHAGLPAIVMNPRQIRDFAKCTGQLAKTDKVDAQIISHYAQAIKPELRCLPSKQDLELKTLNSHRDDIVKEAAAMKNRLNRSESKAVQSSLKRIIKALEKELKRIELKIDQCLKDMPDKLAQVKLLQSVPGVGPVIAQSLVIDLPELGQVSNKELSALVGVAPYNCDSGKMRGKRIVWGGRSRIRAKLYMGTLMAIQYEARIKTFYQRLIKKGKPKKVAIVACMRKMVCMLNSMTRHQLPYQIPA